jgi:AcrR family transcriptional regulator
MQKLKESVRTNILEAAAAEFSEQGFHNASMRKIAAKAEITPGNIYRYYSSKELLLQAVIQPVLEALNQALMQSTDGKLSFFTNPAEVVKNHESFQIDIKKFSASFTEINQKYREEMKFISSDPTYRQKIKEWLNASLYTYFSGIRKDQEPAMVKIMSSIASVALIDGVIECLRFEGKYEELNVQESEVISLCISTIIGKEASVL